MLGVKLLAEPPAGPTAGESPGEGGAAGQGPGTGWPLRGWRTGTGPCGCSPRLLTFQQRAKPGAPGGHGSALSHSHLARSPSQESGGPPRGSGHTAGTACPQPSGGDPNTPQERNLPEGMSGPQNSVPHFPAMGPALTSSCTPRPHPPAQLLGRPPVPRAFSYLAGPPATPPDPPRPSACPMFRRPARLEGEADGEAEGPVDSALGSYANSHSATRTQHPRPDQPQPGAQRGAPRSQSLPSGLAAKAPAPTPKRQLRLWPLPPEPPPPDGSPGPRKGPRGPGGEH